jgi:hypothetical protein
METIKISNHQLEYRNQYYDYGNCEIVGNAVIVNVFDSENNFMIILVKNETTINDVIQTSAQMIYDTLTSNV